MAITDDDITTNWLSSTEAPSEPTLGNDGGRGDDVPDPHDKVEPTMLTQRP